MKTWLTVVAVALLLGGCTSTKSGVEKSYNIPLTNGDGVVVLIINLDADTQADTTSGDAPATTSPRTALGYQGGTAAIAEEGAEMALDGIKSIYEAWQDRRDNRVDNSQTATPVVTPPVVTPVPDPDVTVIPEGDMPFHHTQLDQDGQKDGGKTLVLCPGDSTRFDRVYTQAGFNQVEIPFHKVDEDGRATWWDMENAPAGDIIGELAGKQYTFPTDAGEIIVFGTCP